LAWSQDELKFFKSDNDFYLGNKKLSENEIRRTLSTNSLAFNAWERGNSIRNVNVGMRISTGVLISVGGTLIIVGFIQEIMLAAVTIALFPLYALSGSSMSDDTPVNGWLIGGAVFLSAGTITGIMIPVTKAKYKSYYSDAVDTYNKGLLKTSVSLHIGATGNGFGISLKF
jgi:hypothetical protein